MINSALLYVVGEVFCMAILLTLVAALKPITNFGKREKWLAASLISETLYFAGDAADNLQLGGLVPATKLGLLFTGSYKVLMLNCVSIAVFFYIDQCGEFSLADNKKKRFAVMAAAIISSILELFFAIFQPDWLLTPDLRPTFLYNVVLLAIPLLYSLATIALAINGVRQSTSKNVRRFYLMTGCWPILLVVFGALDVLVKKIPFYAYVITAYLLALAVYQFTTMVDNVSLASLSSLKGREKLKAAFNSIQKRGEEADYFLVLVDMNGLQSINDIYGRATGDQVLWIVSDAVEKMAGHGEGYSCHYGGDEFLAMVKSRDESQVQELISHLQDEVADAAKKADLPVVPQLVAAAVRADMAEGQLTDQLRIAEEKVYNQKQDLDTNLQTGNFFIDKVTGLPNANYFHSFAQAYLDQCLADGLKPAVVMINVTGMQGYNNRFGYAKGDQMLKKLAEALKKAFSEDVLVRFAEDNFLLAEAQEDLGQRLNDLAKIFGIQEGVSIRAGICAYDGKDALMSTVDKAKRALRYLKNDRSIVSQVYNQEVQESYARQDYVLESFQEALDKGWIKPYFQLEGRSLTGQVCAAEALARWEDPKYGVLSPDFFVGILEDAHLVQNLDLYIIRQVCQMLADRIKQGQPVIPISVNLSRIDFQICDIFAEIEKIRRSYDLSSSLLKIEILESTVASDPQIINQAIAKFHEQGYEVWMDDFGSGYSNLNNLDEYNFDLLKIDMIFLKGFKDRPQVKTLLAIVVDMAKKLWMHTLCEGVETEEESAFLREIGCERQQGYLFSKPIPMADFLARIDQEKANGNLENPASNPYYNRISQVNVLADPMHSASRSGGAAGIKLPIAIIEKQKGDLLHYAYMNRSYETFLQSLGYQVEEWDQTVNNLDYFKSVLLVMMDQCREQAGYVKRVEALSGQKFKMEMSYLTTDIPTSNEAYVFTFEEK